MKLFALMGVVTLLFLVDIVLRNFKIKTKYVLGAAFVLTSVFLYNLVLKEQFVDKNLEQEFKTEMVYIQKNCDKKIELPKKLVVQFGKTGDAIGYCQQYINGFKIVINAWYWNTYLDALGRHQLLLHEMMHCIFNVRHFEDKHHFMAPEFDYIKMDELDTQVKNLLKEKCS